MKILEILNKIAQHQKALNESNETSNAAKADAMKSKLKAFIKEEVFSKKEVNQKFNSFGSTDAGMKELMEELISIISIMATHSLEEFAAIYDMDKFKTVYWLLTNSNTQLNSIVGCMKKTGIGMLDAYTPSGKVKNAAGFENGKFAQNMDLFSLIKGLFLYEKGEWVKPFHDFYENFDTNCLELSDILSVKPSENLFDIFKKTNLPIECILELAKIQGSQTPNRGKFETVFALLSRGGKFKVNKKNVYDSAGAGKKQYLDEQKGDIIIDGHGIELKVDMGSGGGRIGGQNGFSDVSGIKKNYRKGLKDFIDFVKNTFNSKDADRQKLVNDFTEAYKNNQIDLNLNRNKKADGAILIDDIAVQACNLCVTVSGGAIDNKVSTALVEAIKTFYKSIWCHIAGDEAPNNQIASLIDEYLIGRKIENIISENSIIPAAKFDEFSQRACGALLAYYGKLEPFDYIFIISTSEADLQAGNARLLSLSNSDVINFNSKWNDILSRGLRFTELPTVYGKNPARATRPMIGLA